MKLPPLFGDLTTSVTKGRLGNGTDDGSKLVLTGLSCMVPSEDNRPDDGPSNYT